MGDRISIQFKTGKEVSVTFFSHWDGKSLLDRVYDYCDYLADELKKRKGMAGFGPIDRLEPNTVMVDFLRWFSADIEDIIDGNYYLGKDPNDGDNSDNGNFLIDLNKRVGKRMKEKSNA